MTSSDVPWLDPDEMSAWVNLIKLASRIVALSDGELRRSRSITGRDYELLHHLSSSDDGWRVNELARLIDDTSGCVTHRVNRLRSAGLVDKQPDPIDLRARRVVLTEAGRELLEQTAPEHVARVRQWIIDPLGHPDLIELARITGLLNQHLRTTTSPAD
jgi:DNA-binding MarR family transcriptional regulator